MANSIKLKNNTYIDSTGITHNQELLSTILTNINNSINNMSTNITSLLARDYIVEQGSNSNGNYVKFNNGLAICWKTLTKKVNIQATYGNSNLYQDTTSCGDLPITFIEYPFISVNNNGIPWAEPSYNGTRNSWGTVRVLYTTPLSNYDVNLRLFAIGKWK